MGEYLRPDVYVERIASGVYPIESVGTATAGIVGTSKRGKVGEPVLVTSWTDYVEQFAKGLPSPFDADSDLSYAVYGYFQNGGSRAYIVRVADSTEKKAEVVLGADVLTVTAVDAGTWANTKLKVSIVPGEDVPNLDLEVEYDGELVEKFYNISEDSSSKSYVPNLVNEVSKYITVGTTIGNLAALSGELSGGLDGLNALTDTHYLSETGIKALDSIDQVTLVAIPGQTSKAVLQGILDYCANRKDCFGVLDMPMGMDTTEALAFKKELGGHYGAIYYPWGKVVDPLGNGKLRLTPPSGHVLGIYARTDRERGVHKAPAGLDALIRGFVETETKLANGHVELLNPQGVNCIVAKPNRGIVVWGARMTVPHLDRKYVSDMRFDINIEKSLYDGTQWTIFEPNDEILWNRIIAQVKAFLYVKWREGALFGRSPEEAYYVKCDAELNTEEIRDAGRVIVEVGYAKKKPVEFTIFKLTQKTMTRY